MSKRVVIMGLLLGWVAVATAEEVRYVPAVSSAPGRFGTTWTTDLWIYNLQDDGPITVWASFIGAAGAKAHDSEVAIEIPPVTMTTVRDAVTELFGLTASGALRLRSDFKFEARSRTYNSAQGGGQLGQGIPAVAVQSGGDEVLLNGAGTLLGAANIPGPSGVRTNLGLLNASDETIEVEVWLFGDEPPGLLLGYLLDLEIGPREWLQTDVFGLVGAADRTSESAHVVFGSLDTEALVGYLSRVDNTSGDATYIDRIVPRRYRMTPDIYRTTMELTYGGVVDVDSITYTGVDGEEVTVIQPPDGWSVTTDVSTNHDFCYRFIGHVDGGETGWARLDYDMEGPGGRSGSRTCGDDGPARCVIEDCFYLP